MRTIIVIFGVLCAVGARGQMYIDSYRFSQVVSADTCGAFVAAGVYKKFLCHNLGANTAAVPTTPSWELIGNHYQWGWNPSCFGLDDIDAVNPCSSPIYGAAAPFGGTASEDNAGSITGWNTVSAANGDWGATKTANDPCPTGWRVPTATELTGVTNTGLNSRTFVGTFTNSTTNYSSGVRVGTSLFFPAAGLRNAVSGGVSFRGSNGYYWSSTEVSANSQFIFMNASLFVFNTTGESRRIGMSVRCIEE